MEFVFVAFKWLIFTSPIDRNVLGMVSVTLIPAFPSTSVEVLENETNNNINTEYFPLFTSS